MLQRLYNWTMDLAGKPNALLFLVVISFAESSFFPLPPDILLIPMVLAARDQAWRYAAFCTIASVIGGIAGYGIGYFLFETVGHPVLDFYGYLDKFEVFKGYYNEWGAWIVAGAGVTPFPYKVITIASGVTNLDFATFSVASVLSRGARFFLVAALLWKFGPPIREFIELHLGKLTLIFFVILIGSFVLIKYL